MTSHQELHPAKSARCIATRRRGVSGRLLEWCGSASPNGLRFADVGAGTKVTLRKDTDSSGGLFGKLGGPVVVKLYSRDVRGNWTKPSCCWTPAQFSPALAGGDDAALALVVSGQDLVRLEDCRAVRYGQRSNRASV